MVYTNRSYFYQAVPLTNHMYDSDDDRFSFAVVCCSSKVQGRGRLTTVVVCIRGRLMFAVTGFSCRRGRLMFAVAFCHYRLQVLGVNLKTQQGGQKTCLKQTCYARFFFAKRCSDGESAYVSLTTHNDCGHELLRLSVCLSLSAAEKNSWPEPLGHDDGLAPL